MPHPTLGRTNLRSLTPTHLRTLLASKAAVGLGARSVQIIHSTLRTLLSEALREELGTATLASLRPSRAPARVGGDNKTN